MRVYYSGRFISQVEDVLNEEASTNGMTCSTFNVDNGHTSNLFLYPPFLLA